MRYFIGIDAGTNTGVAVWDKSEKRFVEIQTTSILKAMEIVKKYEKIDIVQVRLEDARKRKWFGDSGPERLQGAGSVKRDCVIWEEFLNDRKIPYMLIAPKNNNTKLSSESFKKITGYSGRTNEHTRDAAMLVFGI
ncbi:MAG: hypothetical protein IKM23_05680 [Bacteroidales bacterium]|nr:hypothetical protein [Bacteroidales bacterium]